MAPRQVLFMRASGVRFFCTCAVPGKPMSKFQTTMVEPREKVEWAHVSDVIDYNHGDPLEFSIWQADSTSESKCLGTITWTSAQFCPDGFVGPLTLPAGVAQQPSE